MNFLEKLYVSESQVHWKFQLKLSDGSIALLDSTQGAPKWDASTRRLIYDGIGRETVFVRCKAWKPVIAEARKSYKKSA